MVRIEGDDQSEAFTNDGSGYEKMMVATKVATTHYEALNRKQRLNLNLNKSQNLRNKMV